MTIDETTTVLDHVAAEAVRMMLSKMTDHDVTVVFQIVGGAGPIGDLAAEAMQIRNIDL